MEWHRAHAVFCWPSTDFIHAREMEELEETFSSKNGVAWRAKETRIPNRDCYVPCQIFEPFEMVGSWQEEL